MRYDPELNPEVIFLVGVGGTGSHIAMSVGRMLYDMRLRSLATPHLVLVDPDHVEQKNVGRQLFAPQDVDQPKAAVLSRRLNFFMGLNTTYRVEKFDADMVDERRYANGCNTILLGAVDGHEGRQAMSAVKSAVWIDAGNHFDAGQVIIGDTTTQNVFSNRGWKEEEGIARTLPSAAQLYPELLEPAPDPEPQVSCATLVQRGDQHLLINQMMATIASNYLYQLLHRLPVTSYRTHIDLELGIVKPTPITRENLEADLAPAVPA